jgi:hypothetical protein
LVSQDRRHLFVTPLDTLHILIANQELQLSDTVYEELNFLFFLQNVHLQKNWEQH